jgi:hypothetical protein
MQLAGILHDVYDDPHVQVLARISQTAPIHEKVASMELLPPQALQALPDRLFAMVGTVGGELVRKYAMHDEAHMRTSLLYFEQGGASNLPLPTAIKVANNLMVGCGWYGLEPSEDLQKLAGIGTTAMNTLTGVTGAMDMHSQLGEIPGKMRAAQDATRAAQLSGMKVGGVELQYSEQEVQGMYNNSAPPTGNTILDRALGIGTRKATERKMTRQVEKRSDLVGTSAMPRSGSLPGVPLDGNAKGDPRTNKVSHVGDISAAARIPVYGAPDAVQYALWDQFPLRDADQVKTAAAWLEDNVHDLDVHDRRAMAQNILIRGDELDVKVANAAIAQYSGDEYGDHIGNELFARYTAFDGNPAAQTAYSTLYEKRASFPPAVMVSLLHAADDAHGVDLVWNREVNGFRDPYRAVYEKSAAEDQFSWASGTDYTSGMLLQRLAAEYPGLDSVFDEDLVKSFKKDPVGIFKSLPDPQKVVLARLASQQHNGMI